MKIVIRLIIMTLSVLLISELLGGVQVDSYKTAFWAALVIAGLNFFIKPAIQLLALPLTIITLGLFNLVINALMIMITTKIVEGFVVSGWWVAILFSILLSIISGFIHRLIE